MGKKKLFCVSDVHGHFTELKAALNEAGFQKDDPTHLLIACGDFFDRGSENLEVLKFFDRLENKVLLRGNHEDMLLEIFSTGKLRDHNFLNGTVATVTEFFGKYCLDPVTNEIDFSGKSRVLDRVIDFIGETKNYFETKRFVFVHGWLPTKSCDERYEIDPDWRNATDERWKTARWTKWNEMYEKCNRLQDKTIVCGHVPTFYANAFDEQRSYEDSRIFEDDGLVVIDGGTYTSKRVNVFVVEDELI